MPHQWLEMCLFVGLAVSACDCFSPFVCDVGTAPPMSDVNPSTVFTGPNNMSQSINNTLVCDPGFLVCGLEIYRLSSIVMGSNVFVIRDLRIECCSAFNFSSYLTATFSSSISIYFVSTSFQVPFDTIASLNFSQHGVSVNSYPPMDRPVGSGSMTAGELSQSSCPRGYGVSGLYGQVINPDTDRAYFQSLYAYCSVRCSPCPLDFYCIGNVSAARCPLNSHTGPRLGAAAEASCLCSSGYTKRGSTCYCPVALMLGPDGACTQCLNNSVCSGDNIAVPCPMHSAVKFQVASTSPGVCVCVDGYFYSSSMSSCVQCQAGYYCTNNTMTLCWNNSDSLQEGAGGCDCVPGFYATAPRVCSQCPTGSFCVGGQAAEPCRQGWYADTIGSSVCTECPLNSGSPAPGASRLEQCVCAPGFTGFPGSSTCYPCPPGGYCPGYGETMVLCLSGTYQTGYGGRLGSDCSSCDPGTYGQVSGAVTSGACTGCVAGTFQTAAGVSSAAACTACGTGSYGPTTGLTACVLCPEGTVQPLRGASSSGWCQGCVAGTYQTGQGMGALGACKQCPVGTYQTGLGMTNLSACAACRMGTYQPRVGQPSDESCVPCVAGMFQLRVGASSSQACALCAAGSYQSAPGAEQPCTFCGVGTFSTGLGVASAEDCVPCRPGTYQTLEGVSTSLQCASCPAGTFQTGEGIGTLDDCFACNPGTYQSAQRATAAEACLACSLGTYQTGFGMSSSAACALCGPGTYQTAGGGARSALSCVNCQAGTYQSGYAATSPVLCTLCPAGRYLTGVGSSSSKDCVACSSGTYQTATGASQWEACILCIPGTYQPLTGATARTSCLRCPAGTYQPEYAMVAKSACIACGRGVYSSGLGMGSVQACRPCAAGTYQSNQDLGMSACQKCGAGTFQPTPGQSSCDLCRQGSYQPQTGAMYDWWCADCEQGKYSTGLGASSVGQCVACDPGMFSEGAGLTYCKACDPGKYQPDAAGRLCFSCMSGSYTNRTGESACTLCPAGQIAVGAGQSGCSSCGPGQFQYLAGGSVCLSCLPGQFQPKDGSTHCNLCQEGTFQPASNSSQCLVCPPGSYTGQPGATACTVCLPGRHQPLNSSSSCLLCAAGQFQPQSTGTACSPCVEGTFQAFAGASTCQSCKSGEFQPDPAATTCLKCAKGTFHAGEARVRVGDCLNCSAGFYSGAEGATLCSPCVPGLYADSTGLSACAECRPGFFQDRQSGSMCHACTEGTYGSAWGSASETLGCLPCSTGLYSNVTGGTVCLPCAPGTFSDREGQTACLPCGAGTFMDETGWQLPECKPCAPGTYSSIVGATGAGFCALCDNGYFSSQAGQTSSSVCSMCPAGTVSVANKSLCSACGSGLLCPAGYHIPIRCVTGLSCDGTRVEADPGLLVMVKDNCTAAIPCPAGTLCAEKDLRYGKGILPPLLNETQFLVFYGGVNRSTTSCPGRRFYYGYTRIDWPYSVENLPFPVLYWLQPTGCPVGTYLLDDVCTPCPMGTFSIKINALGRETCRACPQGMFGRSLGATACEACQAGTYNNYSQVTVCVDCPSGWFQGVIASSLCLQCSAGEYSNQSASTVCALCAAGTHQVSTGTTACIDCDPTEFSSPGDHSCSRCGVTLTALDSRHACDTPLLPRNRDASIWVSVRGLNSDDCLSRGPNISSTRGSNQVMTSYTLLRARTTCVSTLYVTDRPSLTRSWTTSVGQQLHRPVALTVIPHNTTFYPTLCRRQGFGVLFTVADADGGALTDLADALAFMSILDPSGKSVLFSMGCSKLPQDANANVPLGACRIAVGSFCPTMQIMVRVTLTWAGMLVPPIEGQVVLSPGALGACPPTVSWLASVELLNPDAPFMPGDILSIQVSHLNPPSSAALVVFRFALRILGGFTFLSLQSTYSVVHQLTNGVLSVVGDSSQGIQGRTLSVIRVRLDAAVSGVGLVAQVVPNSFQFTLANAVPYAMLVRTAGFSCRSDGYIDMLADYPRATTLITNTPRASVINWRMIQPSALDYPAAIYVVSVGVVMHSYGAVVGTCTSLDPYSLTVGSCGVIRSRGARGNASALVRVQYQGLVTHVTIAAWVPANATFSIMPSLSGMSGRYRIIASLSASPRMLEGVDASQYIPKLLGLGVTLVDEQWKCSRAGVWFSIGSPTIYSGTCGRLTATPSVSTSIFALSRMQGVAGLGWYTFPVSAISVGNPSAGLIVFSAAGLNVGIRSLALLSQSDQLSVSGGGAVEPAISLKNAAGSARCVGIALNTTQGVFEAFVPVFPGGPSYLQITLSTAIVVRQQDTSLLIPDSTFVIKAFLVFSDGSQLNVQKDPRLLMESNEMTVAGLGAISRDVFVGDAVLIFRFQGIPCITTSLIVKVLASAVKSATLVCPACPALFACDNDPLSQHFPIDYPSSVASSAVLVRKELFDGRVVDQAAGQLTVTGSAMVLLAGRLIGKSGGVASVSSPAATGSLAFTVLHRWAVASAVMCNGGVCNGSALKLAPPEDGAGSPPISYATSLALSLSVGLFDGRTVLYPWLDGVSIVINHTEANVTDYRRPISVPLVYGSMLVQSTFGGAWDMPLHEITDGYLLRVDRLGVLVLHGPAVLYQLHCSGIWEEAHYTVTGTVSDGAVLVLDTGFRASGVISMHNSMGGLFHASGPGEGQVTAFFAGLETVLLVTATVSSKYFTSVGMDFLPAQWSSPAGAPLALTPDFWPALSVQQPWFSVPLLAAHVLVWSSSAPEVVMVSGDETSISLMADSYQPVTVSAALIPCGAFAGSVATKEVSVNVVPTKSGDLDFGAEGGGTLPLVALGDIMSIPVYVFAAERLRAYMVEIDVAGSGLDLVDCSPGVLPGSQCDVVLRQDSQIFRAVGAFSQGNVTGRLLVATVRGRVLLNAVTFVRVSLLQLVVGDAIIPPASMSFLVRLGTDPVPGTPGRRVLGQPSSSAAAVPGVGVYGDTDGDGFFTCMDVLFMESYIAVSSAAYSAGSSICIVRGRCQLVARLTEWQLLQLKPVRHPQMPATRPDGSDLVFLQRALVGKALFLTSLDIVARPGFFSVLVGLRDFEQNPDPVNAVVSLQLVTVANRLLQFDTPSRLNQSISCVTVSARHVAGGYYARTLDSATVVDEMSVRLRMHVQVLDALASDQSAVAQERGFLFLPTGPLFTFNILGSDTLLEETQVAEYLPTLICQTLCDDASLFLDTTLTPLLQWAGDAAYTVSFMGPVPPPLRGFWPVFRVPSVVGPDDAARTSTVLAVSTDGILVGTSFNVTQHIGSGVDMALFRVQTLLPLIAVHGAEAALAESPPSFFMSAARGELATLQFLMAGEGQFPITITRLQAFPAEAQSMPNAVTIQVVGLALSVERLEITPLCIGGVILWSRLAAKRKDEPCTVSVTPYWQNTGQGSPRMLTCSTYPCILQGFGQLIRPLVTTYVPTSPRILIQKPVLALGQRTQWRAVCTLSGREVTVTERALAAGLVQSTPPNVLVVTADSITGTQLGWATVSFAGLVKVGLNITAAVNPPRSLKVSAFRTLTVASNANSGTMAVFFSPDPLLAGGRGYLLLKAVYSGGYTLLLDPTPGVDGISVRNASKDVVVSQIDGSFTIRAQAAGGANVALVVVEYQGVSAVVSASVVPLTPAGITVCCSVELAGKSSALHGHPSFPASFSVQPPVIRFAGRLATLSPRMGDASLQVSYNTDILRYDQAGHRFILLDNAPAQGYSTVVVMYTHPVSLVTVQAAVSFTMVTSDRLELVASAVTLRRIHCLATLFEECRLRGALHVVPTDASLDVTDEMQLDTSDPAVVQTTGGGLAFGAGVGTAVITARVRGFTQSQGITVTDGSVTVQSIVITSPLLVLSGIRNEEIRIQFSGTLQGSQAPSDLSFLWGVAELTASEPVTKGQSPVSLILDRNSLSPFQLRVSLPPCPAPGASLVSTVTSVQMQLVANTSIPSHADVEIRWVNGTYFVLTLVATSPAHAFFIQLQTDASVSGRCTGLRDMPVLSDCSATDAGELYVAGVRLVDPFPRQRSELVGVTWTGVSTIWGFVEIYTDGMVVRRIVQAGQYGAAPSAVLAQLIPGLPLADTSVLYRLFAVRDRRVLRDALFNLLLMVGRQRQVDTRIYSNEFELSAMFRVTDRYLRADLNHSVVRVLFHTDQLPLLPGSALVPGEGLWVTANHVFDGWYVVEFRQKIPALSLAVSFTVQTPTSLAPWTWQLPGPVETGQAVPVCPRMATQTATFLASYSISVSNEFWNHTGIVLQDMLGSLACSVKVASRRVIIAPATSGTMSLSVALESLARVHQANLIIMGNAFTDELQRRLDPKDFGNASLSPPVTIERGGLLYINDTRDAPIPCPIGYYFSVNGSYMLLPAHAVPGADCYDMMCVAGYTLVPETRHCIPVPVSMDVVWICVLVVLSVVIALAALVCCVQVALWRSYTTPVVFDPAPKDQASPAQPPEQVPWAANGDIFEDSDEREAYFQNIVADFVLDDYSMMMLEGEFSPMPTFAYVE